MTIGERIRYRRKSLNLTMQDITKRVGLKAATISELENDKYLPSIQTLVPLCQALWCSTDWLITGDEMLPSYEPSGKTLIRSASLLENEYQLVKMYQELDSRDREEIFDIMKMKLARISAKRPKKSSGSTSGIGIEADDSSSGTA